MIVLLLVALYWTAAHNVADDLCRPTIDDVPTLLCPRGAALGYPAPVPALVSPMVIPHWPQAEQDRAFDQRIRGLLWQE